MNKRARHEHYELLNLIGYGLAKFDMDFVKCLGFKTKTDFYEHMVHLGVADTIGTVKNRQDLFDPFFSNGRKGWWQKGDAYIHRKIHIDSLFKSLDANDFSGVVRLYLQKQFGVSVKGGEKISPLTETKFKQLQITGQEAELFFMSNFTEVDFFKNGALEDARMFGDGYDFQIEVQKRFFLAEVKGLRTDYGSVRMTQKEFTKAAAHENDYALVVVSNLDDIPNMHVVFDPTNTIHFVSRTTCPEQLSYHTTQLRWGHD